MTEKLEGDVSVDFREIGIRELVAEIIDWRARRVRPEDRPGYAAAVVAELFELELELGPVDSSGENRWRECSASELLDQVQDVLEAPGVREELVLGGLREVLWDMDRSNRDFDHVDFGDLCDIYVSEADMPHRALSSDDVSMMKDSLRSELRRRKKPVVK